MKRFATGEPVQKQVRFEEVPNQVENQSQVLGTTQTRRRPVFTPKERQPKKTTGTKKKENRQKSAI